MKEKKRTPIQSILLNTAAILREMSSTSVRRNSQFDPNWMLRVDETILTANRSQKRSTTRMSACGAGEQTGLSMATLGRRLMQQ